jgi:hypothetical protein
MCPHTTSCVCVRTSCICVRILLAVYVSVQAACVSYKLYVCPHTTGCVCVRTSCVCVHILLAVYVSASASLRLTSRGYRCMCVLVLLILLSMCDCTVMSYLICHTLYVCPRTANTAIYVCVIVLSCHTSASFFLLLTFVGWAFFRLSV